MLTIETRVEVGQVTGCEITDFLLDPTDGDYRAWWPGTHLRFHVVTPGPDGHVGDVVRMDEHVGTRRVRMTATVVDAVPGVRIVWQLRKGIRLPARLTLRLRSRDGGVEVRHTITAGWRGAGRVLDPLFRLWLTRRFIREMDEHARTEFPRLGALLAARRGVSA
jgi:hypothetical protein